MPFAVCRKRHAKPLYNNNNNGSCDNNRIYNKILDRDWGTGAYLSRNRRVITRVSNYRCPIIGYSHDFHVNYVIFDGFLRNVLYSFQNLGNTLHTFSLKRSSQKTILIPKPGVDPGFFLEDRNLFSLKIYKMLICAQTCIHQFVFQTASWW